MHSSQKSSPEPETTQVALFFRGTWSTHVEDVSRLGWVARNAHKVMYNATNTIGELHNQCLIEDKRIFDGPGTDIISGNQGSWFNPWHSIVGGLHGFKGNNNVNANLEEAKQYLRDLYHQKRKPLDIKLYGWSRGAFTAWMLKKAIAEMIRNNEIQVAKIHIHNIDPVPGLFERNVVAEYAAKDDPQVLLTSTTYYSHTGNPDLFEATFSRFMNMPAFSALRDDTVNSKQYLMQCTHEDACGHSRESKDKHRSGIGHMILVSIMAESTMQGANFNEIWKTRVYREAGSDMHHYQPAPDMKAHMSRRFLSKTAPIRGERRHDCAQLKEWSLNDVPFPVISARFEELRQEVMPRILQQHTYINIKGEREFMGEDYLVASESLQSKFSGYSKVIYSGNKTASVQALCTIETELKKMEEDAEIRKQHYINYQYVQLKKVYEHILQLGLNLSEKKKNEIIKKLTDKIPNDLPELAKELSKYKNQIVNSLLDPLTQSLFEIFYFSSALKKDVEDSTYEVKGKHFEGKCLKQLKPLFDEYALIKMHLHDPTIPAKLALEQLISFKTKYTTEKLNLIRDLIKYIVKREDNVWSILGSKRIYSKQSKVNAAKQCINVLLDPDKNTLNEHQIASAIEVNSNLCKILQPHLHLFPQFNDDGSPRWEIV